MGRPFQEKFAQVQWEVDEEKFNAWKDGRTGFPAVDAAMRQCRFMGWMHSQFLASHDVIMQDPESGHVSW
jgi:deoxyribodipyrimidine photo-lyase